MADLKEYRYIAKGVEFTAMLNEQDAKRLGAVPVAPVAVDNPPVAGKARTDVPNTARVAPNKAVG